MSFYGLCTYPHGGYTLLGLLLSTGAAFTATVYATSSCRFLIVNFTSDTGNFEEYFSNAQAAAADRTAIAEFQAAAGLFKFLRPLLADDWSEGQCVGYTERMLDVLADLYFEIARVFSVLGVLLSTVVLLWTMATTCMGWNVVQIYLLRGLLFVGTAVSSLVFLVTQSALCESLFLTTECRLGEGGYVMIAGILLWLIAFVVSVVYLRVVDPLDFGVDVENQQVEKAASSPEEQAKIDAEVKRQKARRAAAAARAANKGSSSSSISSESRNNRASGRAAVAAAAAAAAAVSTPRTAKSHDDSYSADPNSPRTTTTTTTTSATAAASAQQILNDLSRNKQRTLAEAAAAGAEKGQREKGQKPKVSSSPSRRLRNASSRTSQQQQQGAAASSSGTKTARAWQQHLRGTVQRQQPAQRSKKQAAAAAAASSQQQQQRRRRPEPVTVDDISNTNSLEVYISSQQRPAQSRPSRGGPAEV